MAFLAPALAAEGWTVGGLGTGDGHRPSCEFHASGEGITETLREGTEPCERDRLTTNEFGELLALDRNRGR